MADIDEHLLTAAKLREQIDGDLDGGDDRLHHSTGLAIDAEDRATLSFMESAGVGDADLTESVASRLATERVSAALEDGDSLALSHFVGVTEQDLEASSLTLPARLVQELDRDGQLTTLLAAGNPNTGKTNTVSLLAELARIHWSDLLVISNIRGWELSDVTVSGAHGLAVSLLENRDVPKFVVVDEASTHFDNRTNSYEVSSQWSPLHKRMSKLGCEVVCVIGHTGKDVDPEVKRLSDFALWKEAPETASFYADWPANSDRPDDRLFGGSLQELEATSAGYDPDDAAPWSWNLEADIFAEDQDWNEILDKLKSRGPVN